MDCLLSGVRGIQWHGVGISSPNRCRTSASILLYKCGHLPDDRWLLTFGSSSNWAGANKPSWRLRCGECGAIAPIRHGTTPAHRVSLDRRHLSCDSLVHRRKVCERGPIHGGGHDTALKRDRCGSRDRFRCCVFVGRERNATDARTGTSSSRQTSTGRFPMEAQRLAGSTYTVSPEIRIISIPWARSGVTYVPIA